MPDLSNPDPSDDSPTVPLPVPADRAGEPSPPRVLKCDASPGGWGNWTFPTATELAAELPGYDVERLIGKGGMGAVFQGRQHALDRTVAIKVLPLELSRDRDFADRFHREARAMARLDHPNIVRVIEFGKTASGLLYFTMEHVDGGDLRRVLKTDGPLPVPHALGLMRELCSALECAHRAGTIHRDIKPANILLTADGHVKVADFGLARVVEGDSDLGSTRTGVVMGTLDYMAPEQRNGAKADPSSDVYAAGVVLYQLLTGKLPQGAWQPPSVLCRGRGVEADERLDQIVNRTLEEDPFARFPDAGAMREAMDALLPAAREPDDTPSARVRPWAMAVAALVAGAGAWLISLTPLGRAIDDRVQAAALSLAAPVDAAAEARVVLLDMSRFEALERTDAGGTRMVTPRDGLLALVRGVAIERPQAIAIDIDFSPASESPGQPYSPDDPAFLRALLQLRRETGVPVFVGVWRQDSAGRDGWLAGAEFAPLAAGIGIAVDDTEVVGRLPIEFVATSDGAALPSLSAALARAAGARDPSNGAFSALMTRRFGPVAAGGLSVAEFRPNYSSLDRLAWQRVSSTDPSQVPGLRERLRGNLVMLSDAEPGASDGDDVFSIPTRRGLQVPGAYIHACGVVTLLSGAPASLTRSGRILAPLLVLCVLAGGLWWKNKRMTHRSHRGHRALAGRCGSWLVIGSVALLAFAAMRIWRVAWPDGLYLGAALLVLRPLAAALQALPRTGRPARRTASPADGHR